MTTPDASTSDLAALGRCEFVRLTTFRRTGEAVPTPVWMVPDDDDPAVLWVTTPAGSGKVKRLRHTPGIRLVACDRRGRVTEPAAEVAAVAQVRDDPAALARLQKMLARKHPVGSRAIGAIEKVAGTVRRLRGGQPPARTALRITTPSA